MPSRLSAQAIRELEQRLGKEQVLHETEDLHTYGYDATPELKSLPDVVLFPRTAEEVAYVVEFANQNGLLSPAGKRYRALRGEHPGRRRRGRGQ